MTVYISTVIVEADEVSHLSQMAEFYKMPVQNLLSDAMAAGLAHAESVMLENERHHAKIKAAMQACGQHVEDAVH